MKFFSYGSKSVFTDRTVGGNCEHNLFPLFRSEWWKVWNSWPWYQLFSPSHPEKTYLPRLRLLMCYWSVSLKIKSPRDSELMLVATLISVNVPWSRFSDRKLCNIYYVSLYLCWLLCNTIILFNHYYHNTSCKLHTTCKIVFSDLKGVSYLPSLTTE